MKFFVWGNDIFIEKIRLYEKTPLGRVQMNLLKILATRSSLSQYSGFPDYDQLLKLINNNEKGIKDLVSKNPLSNDEKADTLLTFAVRENHIKVIHALIENNADINSTNSRGGTALIFAALIGHEEVVRCLLAAGAKVDKEKKDGWTALMSAAHEGHEEVVRCLLAEGAKVDKEKKDGWTALMSAAQEGHEEVVRCLLAEGAKVDKECQDGCTALMSAAQEGHEEVVRCLLAEGAKVDKALRDGWTALMFAAHEGHEEVVRRLLIHQYKSSASNAKARKAFYEKQTEKVKQLVSYDQFKQDLRASRVSSEDINSMFGDLLPEFPKVIIELLAQYDGDNMAYAIVEDKYKSKGPQRCLIM